MLVIAGGRAVAEHITDLALYADGLPDDILLGNALGGEGELSCPQSLVPGLCHRVELGGTVGASEESSLGWAFCAHKDRQTLVHVACQVSSLECYIVLAARLRRMS